jgi:hypothetical protein
MPGRSVEVVIFDYCTGMVTVFEVAPPMAITTGIAAPFDDPAGTIASTWYSPTEPGARPENNTVAGEVRRSPGWLTFLQC